jgi:hemolysin III
MAAVIENKTRLRHLARKTSKPEQRSFSKVRPAQAMRSIGSRGLRVMNYLDGRPAGLVWNYDRLEIIADGIVHAVGLTLGLGGAIAILIAANNSVRGDAFVPLFIYLAGLLAMLALSATYNMWPVCGVKWLLRRFDHSAIYLLIAGTYTPLLAQMKVVLSSAGLTIGIWLVAALGIVLKLVLPGRFERLSITLYLLLGWSGVIVYNAAVSVLPTSSLWLIAAGGALYSIGLIFHFWQRLRFQNAIWHAFVVLAASCHYIAVVNSVGLLPA